MILSGKPVAQAIEQEIIDLIEKLQEKSIKPAMAVVLVGNDPASLLYTRKKHEKAESLGIGFKLYHFPADFREDDLVTLINDLNKNKNIHGIIVQSPLPDNINPEKVLAAIDIKKDIDGLNNGFTPPAAGAILELLDFYNIDLTNKKIVLVGRGKLVGAPLEKLFLAKNIKAMVCDSKTADLSSKTKEADVIISAVGKPGLITTEMVSEKSIIIDAGTAEMGGQTAGDVDSKVYEKVAAYSPVPGGIGPITVIKLMKNLIEAAAQNEQY